MWRQADVTTHFLKTRPPTKKLYEAQQRAGVPGLTALRPALIYGFINALLEVLPCGVLLRALWLVFNGTATVMDVLWLSLVLLTEFVDQPLLPVPVDPRMPQDASVDIVDVGFAHAADSTLEAVSLNIPAGSVLALVGPSGSGKTTLAGLVARLWDVDRGSIRIGGVDIRDMSPDILNDTVGMVLQDVSLFGVSARDNIRLGKPDADDEQVMAAARAARIHDRIMQLPQGYDTMLESGDGLLSGGERQRIAIARALIRNAPVLILDEASASVDLENEWLIREALRDLMRGRTVIVIAHRLWLASGADRIALMSNGRVTETGSHSELMAAKGHYARLIEAQSSASSAMF